MGEEVRANNLSKVANVRPPLILYLLLSGSVGRVGYRFVNIRNTQSLTLFIPATSRNLYSCLYCTSF